MGSWSSLSYTCCHQKLCSQDAMNSITPPEPCDEGQHISRSNSKLREMEIHGAYPRLRDLIDHRYDSPVLAIIDNSIMGDSKGDRSVFILLQLVFVILGLDSRAVKRRMSQTRV